ncbi:MAG: (d)CMP kinase [Christensenellales bacterium]|jgi:cytidylate kinase
MANIAIDGPAGAGKSTVAKEIARLKGIIYLDTGAMYRAVALKAIRQGIDCSDATAVSDMLDKTQIKVLCDGVEQRIFADGEDITSLIRTNEVSTGASKVAVIPAVRLKLVDMQRAIAKERDVVMDGRDIGTYVLPDAKHKFFVTASVDERARRRWLELKQRGQDRPLEEIKAEIEFRDKNDSSREFAPLKQADDAVLVDTTDLNIDQVIEKILALIG